MDERGHRICRGHAGASHRRIEHLCEAVLSYPTVYGTLGGFIVLVLWIYIASLILLVGAEIDREIEQARNKNQA